MASRRLLVLARLDPEQKRVLGVAATANQLELSTLESVEPALTWLERNQPAIVVFDTDLPRAERLCAKLRSNPALAFVPIIGLTAELNDALAPKFYAIGADDLIPASLGAPLLARLRVVEKEHVPPKPSARGKAVVADADKARGNVFGRVLANAGYDVKYALDTTALRFYAEQTDAKLIVANAELGDPKPLIESSRRGGSNAVWIVTAQRRELEALTSALGSIPRLRVMGLGAPPENVLFTSNELASENARPLRTAPRTLYGTVVAFREAGTDWDELGFTYNISAAGLYVRTLAPPIGERVWLELRPPKAKQRVRLEGRVAWRQSFFELAGAIVPPGFGVELTGGLGDGLEAWRDGHAELGSPGTARRRPLAKPRPDPVRPPPPPSAQNVESGDRDTPVSGASSEATTTSPALPPRPTAPVAEPRSLAATPPAPKSSRALLIVFVVLGAIAGAAAALFAIGPRPLAPTSAPETEPTPAPSAPSPPAASPARPPATDVATDAPAERSVAPPEETVDPSQLLTIQGYLRVRSSATLDVYSTGAKIGPTNTPNVSRCGLRYVRLGEGDPVAWRSEGLTVDVKCQALTEVSIEPLP